MITGFEEDTQHKHMEVTLKKLESLLAAETVMGRYARGSWSTQGFIQFQDQESLNKFVTKSKTMVLFVQFVMP